MGGFFMETTAKTKLDEQNKQLIKATVPILQKQGTAITKRFYQLMLSNHPELNHLFNQTNQRRGDQPIALANTVYAAAANIDQLEKIVPHVRKIAHKHRSLNVKPDQYPIVGKYLLLAMKDVLGDVASDEIIAAWEKAYGIIAQLFIDMEQQLYEEAEAQTGGWTGFRNFKVIQKIKESDVITSFYLQPEDGLAIPDFFPGQYITLKAEIPEEPYTHLRQYSLSTSPNKGHYRISVKREAGDAKTPNGMVSNFLHESVNEGSVLPLTAPAGDFFLNRNDNRPIVLLSGGVGITPMMSMLETVIHTQPNRKVVFIHAAKSDNYHAFKDRINTISKQHANVSSYTLYSQPENEHLCDVNGYISYNWLHSVLPTTNASFYFCGPKGFMQTTLLILKQLHVDDADIHYEVFGPAADMSAS